ncbi:hypothetical protein VV02_01925 [Luteipulveratus mongoliensis]|uniref:Cholesterol esterase n=1 Tax=Luteipulveratus mongoliensis TaxID=571913 RepID=A0A0K1JDW8_9MICO|nr:hypothetical protein VV02_01925 [Luteipulveratus mongoliensis]
MAVPLVAGFAGLGVMATLTTHEVLAVDFPTATSNYRVYSDQLSGESVAAYAGGQAVSDGTRQGVVQLAIGSAEVHGLCVIASQKFAGLGNISVVLTAGEKVDGTPTSGTPALKLDKLVVSTSDAIGEGSGVGRLELGRASETLTVGGDPWKGTPGTQGLQAQTLTLDAADISAAGLQVSSPLKLPGLRVKTVLGDGGVADASKSGTTPDGCR